MVAIDELLSVWEERLEQGAPISPEELCRQCPEMLGEVRWHIRALQAVDSQFGATQNDQAPSTVKPEPAPDPIRSGPVRVATEYRIERLHASGGLGHVFLATDPVLNRKVAIKFPKWSRLSIEQRARFEREARVTGRLDHPGIVPVHSLKQDDPNRPCYVMRFVEGPTLHQTIRQLHDEAGETRSRNFYYALGFRQLLQNLIALSNIVAYAHGQGVVHRDIKPGNVILGPFGETMLLDWGLAKIIGEQEELPLEPERKPAVIASLDTRDGQVMGTPAFASPEQLLGQTDEVDHRSDIYSLGATLYFLLSGKYPADSESARKQIEDVTRGNIIAPRMHYPRIPLALDAICRHAMTTDPARRYQSVSGLTVDLERFLAGEAVSVVADSFWTKCGRFLRRRPGFVAATLATVLMAVVAGLAGSAMLNQKNRELVRSNDRLATAVSESRLANQQSLVALRSLVDDVVIRDLSENKMLDGAERVFLNKILEQYSVLASVQGDSLESRAIRAEGLMQMGKIQMRLSDEEEALERLEAAVEQFQKLVDESGQFGPRLQLAETLSELGDVLIRLGRLDQASERSRAGIDLLKSERLSAAEQKRAKPVLAGLYRVLGNVQQGQHQWSQARQSLDQARQFLESLLTAEPSSSAAHQQMLAAVYRHLGETSAQLGDRARQVEFSERALELQRQLVKQFPDQPDHELGLALACINCSRHRESAGQITAAIEELSEAMLVAERLASRFPQVARYRETVAGLHSRRGNLEWKQERPEQAEADLDKAINLFRKLAVDFPDVPEYGHGMIVASLSLGEIKFERSRVPAAERIFLNLFDDVKKFGDAFPDVASRSITPGVAHIEFAKVRLRQGRAVDNIRPLEQVIARFGDLARSDESATPRLWQARACMKLGWSQVAMKMVDKATPNLDHAAKLLAELAGRHPDDFDLLSQIGTSHRELASNYTAARNAEQAKRHRERELELRVRVADESPDNPYYQVLYARSLMEQGDDFRLARELPVAQELYARAASTLKKTLASFPEDRLVRMTMGDLRANEGRVLFLFRDFAGAETKFAEAVELNPSLENRSSRANNLSRFRPEKVLEQIDEVLADRIPDTMPLKSLMIACGTAANNLADPEMRVALGDRMVRILQHMVDDDYLPHPGTIRQLQSGGTFAVFQSRVDYIRLVQALHERNRNQMAPALVRALPEPIQPAVNWLSSRTIDDLSLPVWVWRALQAWRQGSQ